MEELKIEVLDVKGKWVIVKIGRLRKPRELIAFMDDQGRIIAQGDDVIFMVDPVTREAVYNLKGGYFMHLNPLMGAKVARVPQEFVDALKKSLYEKGEVIGYLPEKLGGSPIIFGGCKTI